VVDDDESPDQAENIEGIDFEEIESRVQETREVKMEKETCRAVRVHYRLKYQAGLALTFNREALS
jgi:hypothetical protein